MRTYVHSGGWSTHLSSRFRGPIETQEDKTSQDILKIFEEESIVSGFTSSSYRLPGSRIMKQS